MNFAEYLKSSPLIAILRGITVPEVPGVCAALLENGIALLEIPLNTPNALECIKEAGKYAANRQLVGAGTVLTVEDVEMSVLREENLSFLPIRIQPSSAEQRN